MEWGLKTQQKTNKQKTPKSEQPAQQTPQSGTEGRGTKAEAERAKSPVGGGHGRPRMGLKLPVTATELSGPEMDKDIAKRRTSGGGEQKLNISEKPSG